jgi:hypothetical protein
LGHGSSSELSKLRQGRWEGGAGKESVIASMPVSVRFRVGAKVVMQHPWLSRHQWNWIGKYRGWERGHEGCHLSVKLGVSRTINRGRQVEVFGFVCERGSLIEPSLMDGDT